MTSVDTQYTDSSSPVASSTRPTDFTSVLGQEEIVEWVLTIYTIFSL